MTKTITKTTNPIHFEDLDPKRFEDLVRELIYDFKEWQSIEATGKGGADDGFDIRAYERQGETVLDEDGVETVHPMDGNLWMIQCKRESQIGPSKLKNILEDVHSDDPPYGYILAAPANFSKKSLDAFREVLRAKGVMEFYLWGKPDLEGQLHLPKNDRILFTFFGISNVSRRRSRATEIRFGVTNKNKILRILGDAAEHTTVLIRDSKDTKYPSPGEYPDFDTRPRWKQYSVVDSHPLGLIVKVQNYYACYDTEKRTYDVADFASLIFRDSDTEEERQAQGEKVQLVRDYWENMPRRCQAEFHLDGLIRYDSMLVIDDKGDNLNECPHIYVDFMGDSGPFKGYLEYLVVGQQEISTRDLNEVKRFPEEFPKPKFGVIHDSVPLSVPKRYAESFVHYRGDFKTLYDCDGMFDHLSERDVALVRGDSEKDAYLQVTHTYQTTVGQLLEDRPHLSWEIEQQIGRRPGDEETISVIEFRRTSEWEFNPK